MPLFAGLSLSAVVPWLFPAFPLALLAWLLCTLAIAGWFFRATRPWVVYLLPMGLTLATIQHRLADRLTSQQAGRVMLVTGTIAGLPAHHSDLTEFLFRPEKRSAGNSGLPSLIRVRWHNPSRTVQAGERWRFELRLQPPRGRVNFSGPDAERRYFSNGTGALATVTESNGKRLQAAPGYSFQAWRGRLRDTLRDRLNEEPAMPQLVALALADRSLLSPAMWEVFSLTGTGHLLAISGMHIGFAASMGYWLGRLLLFLPGTARGLRLGALLPWAGASTLAVTYASLAGFTTSTRRALVMLLLLAGARLSRRSPGLLPGWCIALFCVLALEPPTVLTAGFWLSFVAVLVLAVTFSPRVGYRGSLKNAVLAQLAITITLAPLGLYWFQRSTLLGLIGNLFSIPAISLVIVPLTLLGVVALALGLDGFSSGLLHPASWAMEGLYRALSWLAGHGAQWTFRSAQPGFGTSLLAFAALLLVLGPRGFRARYLALLIATGLLMATGRPPAKQQLRAELLDVGQGTSVLLATRDALTLYDTGPGQPGEWDLAESTLLPAILSSGLNAPSRILVSHGDLDHAGGLQGITQYFPGASVWANTGKPGPGFRPCHAGLEWSDATAAYRVLHPSPYLPYLGNRSSCVLSVRTASASILLPGDIDGAVERRLVEQGISRHTVLIAPHHGSRTSSTEKFLETLHPSWILIPAGAGNRFGFPHPAVLERYRNRGIRSAAVSDCGALRLDVSGEGLVQVTSARRQRAAIWRWPAAPGCP